MSYITLIQSVTGLIEGKHLSNSPNGKCKYAVFGGFTNYSTTSIQQTTKKGFG